jgi:hypothetical protein
MTPPCINGYYGGGSLGNFSSPWLSGVQTHDSTLSSRNAYSLDSLIFDSVYIWQNYPPRDTHWHVSAFNDPAKFNGKNQYNCNISPGFTTINETYADSLGLVSQFNFYENTTSTVVNDSLVYYHKAATGEHWGHFAPARFVTGLPDIPENRNVNILPNPASENFTISVAELTTELRLKLYDLTGREIIIVNINSSQTNVSCNNMAAGIYCWQLESSNGIVDRGKIVIR